MSKQRRIEDLLKDVYTERLARNPRYSKRAFARQLGVSPTTIQNILSRTNQPKLSTLRRLVSALTKEKSAVDSIVRHHMERMRTVGDLNQGDTISERVDHHSFTFSLRSAEVSGVLHQAKKLVTSLTERADGDNRPIIITVKLQ